MKIHVTQEDIDAGKRYNSEYCPVALALKRKLPRYKWTVGHRFLHYKRQIKTPKSVSRKIAQFDGGYPVEPFAFSFTLK